MACALGSPCPSSLGPTHRRVPDAAGEGNPAALPARVQVSAVEIDIEVPVIRPSGSTARPLRGDRRAPGEPRLPQEPHPVWRQAQAAGDRVGLGWEGVWRQLGRWAPPHPLQQKGRTSAQTHQSSTTLLPRLVGAAGPWEGVP